MKSIPIGLQLYSIREECARDFPAALKSVAGMGYAGVELAGFNDYPAPELKRILDDLGLKVFGSHTLIDLLRDEFEMVVESNQALGNSLIVVPGLVEQYRESLSAWMTTAELFNDVAQRLKPHGLQVGLHNHREELKPVGGVVPLELFFSNTLPEVFMQPDLGHLLFTGTSPVEFMKKFPGRALSVHVKEHSATNDKALVGEGDMPWEAVFDCCETIGGTGCYIVEQEVYPLPPLESVAACLDNLRRMGKLNDT